MSKLLLRHHKLDLNVNSNSCLQYVFPISYVSQFLVTFTLTFTLQIPIKIKFKTPQSHILPYKITLSLSRSHDSRSFTPFYRYEPVILFKPRLAVLQLMFLKFQMKCCDVFMIEILVRHGSVIWGEGVKYLPSYITIKIKELA